MGDRAVKPGFEEGDTCNRDGCKGTMVFAPENCSCHINPPCGSCLDGMTCDKCGWREGHTG